MPLKGRVFLFCFVLLRFWFIVFLIFCGQLYFHMPFSAAKIWLFSCLLACLPAQNLLFHPLRMEPILEWFEQLHFPFLESLSFRQDWHLPLYSWVSAMTRACPISSFHFSGPGDWFTNGHVTSSIQWDLFLERNSFSWGYEMNRTLASDIWWPCCSTWVP